MSKYIDDVGVPRVHAKGQHDSTVHNLLFVPYSAKIADITETDTNKHFLNLATALSETRKIVAVSVAISRGAGAGGFILYPNEGAVQLWPSVWLFQELYAVANGTQRLQYAQETANDDFDLYCFGYFVDDV